MKVIGLALKKDKCDKHISQDLIEKARASGFELKVLDPDLPLEEQGRLDAILQKLRNPGAPLVKPSLFVFNHRCYSWEVTSTQ